MFSSSAIIYLRIFSEMGSLSDFFFVLFGMKFKFVSFIKKREREKRKLSEVGDIRF